MFKKHKSLLLVLSILLVLSFVFAACAPAAEEAAAEEPAAAEEEAVADEPAAEEEAPADKEVVKLAFIGPLTGTNAAMGQGGLNSFTLAIDEANADPNGKYTYEIMAIDDECKPEVGVQAALKAASDPDIVASAGHYCSMVAISTNDTFHNNGLANIVWGAVLPAITNGNDYIEVSRVNGTQVEQNQLHVNEMVNEWGFKTVSIIHDTADYGKGHAELFEQFAEEAGLEILSVQGVTIDQTDFSTELTKVKAEAPDVLYFGGLTDIGVPLRTQMVKLGMDDIQFNGTSGIKTDAFIEGVGADNAEGVIAWMDGAPMEKLPGGPAFMAAYEAAGFEEPPEAYGAFAYVAGKVIVAAVEAEGPDRAKVAEHINTTNMKDTIIGDVVFNEYGQNELAVATPYIVQDGVWVVWEDSEYASGVRTLAGQ